MQHGRVTLSTITAQEVTSVQVRARVCTVVCAATVLTAAGCARIGGEQPTPSPIPLPTLATATPTAAPKSDDELLAGSRNAIVRIEGVDCDQSYTTGTGFFFQPGLVVTANHVVSDQQTLAVRTQSSAGGTEHVFSAEVIGHNDTADVAVLRLQDDSGADQPLPLAGTDPTVGTQILAIGHPRGLPIDPETGRITGVDQDTVVTEGDDRRQVSGALRFTAPAGAGNNGGPLLDQTGQVVGMVDTGSLDETQIHYAIPATTVGKLAEGFAASPDVESPSACPTPEEGVVTVKSSHPDAPGVALAARKYFEGINAGDAIVDEKAELTGFEQAYQQLSGSRLTTYPTLESFRDTHQQRILRVRIESVDYRDDTSDAVRLTYDYQDLANGSASACRRRAMDYTMSIATGAWTFADQEVRKRSDC
jgi:S1-C subfamily serine protease